MRESGQMDKVHISPIVWAEKTDTPKGRTCLHASKGSKAHPSLNDSIDADKCDAAYPPMRLPLLPDIAELACQQRDRYPGEQLSGATVDISSAYNQIVQSAPSALTHGVRLKTIDGAGVETIVIVIYLVAMFGFSRAGNIYCQCASAIDQIHNDGLPTRRSETYIDDGLLIDPPRLIERSVEEYIAPALKMFGEKDVINRDKVKIWPGGLQGIGWHFNFEKWTVQPKGKGMAKMLHSVFDRVPVGASSADVKELETVTGILSWYATGIPAGRSYLSSLFACKNRVGSSTKRVRLTAEAKSDLTWWRALLIVAHRYPESLAASIDAVRRVKTPSLYMRTDASSLIGGGAVMSVTKGGPSLDGFAGDAIRWTVEELKMFETMGISINVLEYYAVQYYVMLWGDKLKGEVIHIECDNTSAVAWIVKARAGHSPAADALSKLFSLFCLKWNITIICTHIKGIDNTVADFRSRDLNYLAQAADEVTAAGSWQAACSRQELCRRLLRLSVLTPEQMHGPNALAILISLQ